ncbi:MAG: hypothetical protein AAGU32_09590, partial [Bacillota bacterium]
MLDNLSHRRVQYQCCPYPEINGKPNHSGMICPQGDGDAEFLKSVKSMAHDWAAPFWPDTATNKRIFRWPNYMETFCVYFANEKYKGADIVANYSAEELLDFFTILTPYLNEIFTEDVDVSVIKEGYYTSYAPGKSFDFKVKVGDPMQGKASEQCMATGQKVVRKVSKEQSAFGAPYIACAYPFKNGNKVV